MQIRPLTQHMGEYQPSRSALSQSTASDQSPHGLATVVVTFILLGSGLLLISRSFLISVGATCAEQLREEKTSPPSPPQKSRADKHSDQLTIRIAVLFLVVLLVNRFGPVLTFLPVPKRVRQKHLAHAPAPEQAGSDQ